METKNGSLEVMQGEQFQRLIGGVDYDACDQILLVLYREPERDNKTYFIKEADTDYPNAQILLKTQNASMPISIEITEEMTKTLPLGEYYLEAKFSISGVLQPIIKGKKKFFTLVKSEL